MSLKPIPKQIRELRGLTKFQKEVIITDNWSWCRWIQSTHCNDICNENIQRL